MSYRLDAIKCRLSGIKLQLQSGHILVEMNGKVVSEKDLNFFIIST